MPPAITSYCSLEDLAKFGVGAAALRNIPPADLLAAIVSASRIIDSYLKPAEYTLPLTRVGADVQEAAAVIAAWRLMKTRGYNPNDPAHELIRTDFEDKVKWLQGIASGSVIPDVDDAGGLPEAPSPEGKPLVVSNVGRGWQDDRGGPFSGGRR
jgi:phage gp36-like protein